MIKPVYLHVTLLILVPFLSCVFSTTTGLSLNNAKKVVAEQSATYNCSSEGNGVNPTIQWSIKTTDGTVVRSNAQLSSTVVSGASVNDGAIKSSVTFIVQSSYLTNHRLWCSAVDAGQSSANMQMYTAIAATPTAGINQACINPTRICTTNAACTSGTCQCLSGYIYSDSIGYCVPSSVGINQACSNPTRTCPNNADCSSGTCQCLSGYTYSSSRGYCVANAEINILRHLDVKTSLSSTAHNWSSDLAIDGKIGPDPICNCCSGTYNSQMSWWMADLGQQYPINSITVYSRNEEQFYQHLTGFQVFLANITGHNYFHLLEKGTRKLVGDKHVITFSSTLTRYIRIQRSGVLTLCEVTVTEGECQTGTFGEECSQFCHCADERACDKSTGYCQSDVCKSGWTGLACNLVENINSGTQPSNANEKSAYLLAGTVGGSVAVLIIIVLTITVVVLVLRKRKSETNKTQYSTPDSRINNTDSEYDTLDNINGNNSQADTTVYDNAITTNL